MGRETILFKSERKKTKTEIGNFLRLIADKVEHGELTQSYNVGEIEWTVGANEQGSMVIV